MNTPRKDARSNTYAIQSARDMLKKLDWEIDQLHENVGKESEAFVAQNIAMTAYHTIDWIAAELTERKGWEGAANKIPVEITENDGSKSRLKALQKLARTISPSMEALEQIALASKHRDLTRFNDNLSTMSGKYTVAVVGLGKENEPVEVVRSINYAQRDFVGPDGIPTREARSVLQLAYEARDWLTTVMDKLGL